MIPRIIHQVWLEDSKNKPPLRLMMSWRLRHPTYKYHIWNESNVSDLICQDQLNNSKRMCKKADIIRLEMLYKYGGIYTDCDVLCLKSFEPLLDTPYSFFAGYQWTYKKGGGVICNAVMAANKNNPLIYACLMEIKKLTPKECAQHAAVNQTGPYLLTRIWNERKVGKIYPPSYFYPLQNTDFIDNKLPEDWKEKAKDAYSLHFWAAQFDYDYINSL